MCTKAKTIRRTITIRTEEEYYALQAARKRPNVKMSQVFGRDTKRGQG
jgi:hypothetical protein